MQQSINTLNGTMETLITTLKGAVQGKYLENTLIAFKRHLHEAIQSQAQVKECRMNDEQNQQREKADRRLTEEVKQREEDQERQGTPTSC